MKVLHIEDDTQLGQAIGRMLHISYEAVVVTATTADQAIKELQAANTGEPFDLVISDWNLAGNSCGGDVLEWARDHLPLMLRRWMFLSGDEKAVQPIIEEILVKTRHVSIPFVLKPATNDMTRKTIAAVLERAKNYPTT